MDWNQWCGQIPRIIQSPWSLTLQGGNPPMNPIPQWSGEVLECNQSCWNQPTIPMFDPVRLPHGPHANGMIGFVNNLEKITQQMGQISVQTSEAYSWSGYAATC